MLFSCLPISVQCVFTFFNYFYRVLISPGCSLSVECYNMIINILITNKNVYYWMKLGPNQCSEWMRAYKPRDRCEVANITTQRDKFFISILSNLVYLNYLWYSWKVNTTVKTSICIPWQRRKCHRSWSLNLRKKLIQKQLYSNP